MTRTVSLFMLAAGIGLTGCHWLERLTAREPARAVSETRVESFSEKGTVVPRTVAGEGVQTVTLKVGEATEVELKGDDGSAFVFFSDVAFTTGESHEVKMSLEDEKVFFVEAQGSLGLSSEAEALSKMLSVDLMSGGSLTTNQIRLSIPLTSKAKAKDLSAFDIYAVFETPVTTGNVQTTRFQKTKIDYAVKDLVSFVLSDLPAKAVLVGVPK